MTHPVDMNYAVPDPAWDYSEIYHDCQDSKAQLELLIIYMSGFEDSTPESDARIKELLDTIGQILNTARSKMNH